MGVFCVNMKILLLAEMNFCWLWCLGSSWLMRPTTWSPACQTDVITDARFPSFHCCHSPCFYFTSWHFLPWSSIHLKEVWSSPVSPQTSFHQWSGRLKSPWSRHTSRVWWCRPLSLTGDEMLSTFSFPHDHLQWKTWQLRTRLSVVKWKIFPRHFWIRWNGERL